MQLFAVNFISLQGNSTCFGCFPHPSSGVHKILFTASDTGHSVRYKGTFVPYSLTCTGGCRYSLVYSWWWVWKVPKEVLAFLAAWCMLSHERLQKIKKCSLHLQAALWFFFFFKTCIYEGGPKYFRNLNLPHKRDIVQGSATTYIEPTIFWTSLPSDIALRASCQIFWRFF